MDLLRRYVTVTNPEQLPELLERAARVPFVALDTETSGLNIYQPDFALAGVGVALSPHEGFYLPVGHVSFGGLDYQPANLPVEAVREFVGGLFARTRVVMHNAAYDRLVFARCLGLPLEATACDDTMVALHLKDENHPLSLKAWAKTLLDVDETTPKLEEAFEDVLQTELLEQSSTLATAKNGRSYRKKVWQLREDWLERLYGLWRRYHTGAVSFDFTLGFTAKLFGLLRLRGVVEYAGAFPSDFRYVPVRYGAEYALDDVMNTHALWSEAEAFFRAQPQLGALYREVELPVNDVMTRATARGVLVDERHLRKVKRLLEERIEAVREETLGHAASLVPPEMALMGDFSFDSLLGSSRQLSRLLYEVLGYEVLETTEKGSPSTAKQVLEKLVGRTPRKRPDLAEPARAFLEGKLKYEALRKLHSTYTDSILEKLDAHSRIHTSYNTVGTVSGRMSSNSPNFQNMPRLLPEEVASKPWLQGVDIRQAFVADPGYVFVSADYTSMELVVCAALSGDATMTRLLNEGRDLHSYTARYAFKVGMDLSDEEFKKKYKDYRQKAKVVNFALIYGGTKHTLVRNFGFAELEAESLIEGYFEAYPKVAQWMRAVYDQLEEHGCVVYPEYGYVKRMDAAKPKDRWDKEGMRQYKAALRTCQNALIQGYSAFVVKEAIVKMTRRFAQEGLDAQVIYQVHDEVGVLARLEHAPRVSRVMLETMQRDLNGVKLLAEPEYKLTMSKAEAPLTEEDLSALLSWAA